METNTGTITNLDDELGLIDEEDYRRFRRVNIEALRNERSRGKGPAFTKVGSKVKYFRAAIEQEVAARTVTPRKRAPLLTDRRKPRRPK